MSTSAIASSATSASAIASSATSAIASWVHGVTKALAEKNYDYLCNLPLPMGLDISSPFERKHVLEALAPVLEEMRSYPAEGGPLGVYRRGPDDDWVADLSLAIPGSPPGSVLPGSPPGSVLPGSPPGSVLPGWKNPTRVESTDGVVKVFFNTLRLECEPKGISTLLVGECLIRAFFVQRSWVHYEVEIPGTKIQVGDLLQVNGELTDLLVRVNGELTDLERPW